jgi:hypothetical protein
MRIIRESAFVAVGALFGIKPIGSDTKHVVALDADAMNDGTDDRAGLWGAVHGGGIRIGALFGSDFSGHRRILACGGATPKETRRHLPGGRNASFRVGNPARGDVNRKRTEPGTNIEKAARLLLE